METIHLQGIEGLLALLVIMAIPILIGWRWMKHKDWQMRLVGLVMVAGVVWNFINGWG